MLAASPDLGFQMKHDCEGFVLKRERFVFSRQQPLRFLSLKRRDVIFNLTQLLVKVRTVVVPINEFRRHAKQEFGFKVFEPLLKKVRQELLVLSRVPFYLKILQITIYDGDNIAIGLWACSLWRYLLKSHNSDSKGLSEEADATNLRA